MTLDPAVLKQTSLFSGLADRDLEKLIPLFHRRQFDTGHVITEEGKQGVGGFFVIESGTAAVTVRGEERTTLGPGSYFGEIALLDDGPRAGTVTATSPVSTQMLSAWDFRPFVRRDAALAWAMLEGVARMLRGRES